MHVSEEPNVSNKTKDQSNKGKNIKVKNISSDVLHSRFHKSEGVMATISLQALWEDVKITPSIDTFCTSCKIISIPHKARVRTRTSSTKKFLEEIQVDTVPNPEPLGVSNESRANLS